MKKKSVHQHSFSNLPRANIPRAMFDRSHQLSTTFDASALIPIFVDEALPGDTFNLNSTLFGRLATPIVPIMDNIYLDTFYFAVPNRLLWEDWNEFMGETDISGEQVEHLVPQIVVSNDHFGSLSDYMGIPPRTLEDGSISAFWHRAYNKIWNEWFRDQNLQYELDVPLDAGPDSLGLYSIQKRNKKHDYFTSCLPWPQKGEAVALPVSNANLPVLGNGLSLGLVAHQLAYPRNFVSSTGSTGDFFPVTAIGEPTGSSYNTLDANFPQGKTVGIVTKEVLDNIGHPHSFSGMIADASSVTAFTINQLREAFQIQKLWERDARCGTRYTEILQGHFGVTSPDFRLQRSEYLGGSSQRININPVQQTSASTAQPTPLGSLGAYATVVDNRGGFYKSFTEHMTIIGLANVRCDLKYQNGLNRMWSRQTRFDYYWPALAHLGEQEVLNKELFLKGNTDDDLAFGYQERWAEYRYKPSLVTGRMRTTPISGASLSVWNLSENFAGHQTINDTWIMDKSDEVLDLKIAVNTEPQILLDCYFDLKCTRPIPLYSVPGLIDHF